MSSKGFIDDDRKKAYNASMNLNDHKDSRDESGTQNSESELKRVEGGGKTAEAESSATSLSTPQKQRKARRAKKHGLKKLNATALVAIALAGIIVFAILAFPRLDAYLLDRADTVAEEQARIAAELAEDGFEPIAERVIEDVRSNIYRPRAGTEENGDGGSEGAPDAQVTTEQVGDSNTSALIEQEINAQSSNEVVVDSQDDEFELDPFGLLFLMREAVIAYDDAGEFAREGRYNTAYSYLNEAETLFRELIAIIDEGAHTLDGDDRQGADQLRRSAEYFLAATEGAKQFVQGIEPDVDIAAEDARARTELREARALLESKDN